MKILLIGEYSNVHNTLADGLRILGHKVVVASNGDFWKNYPRDIDLQRDLTKKGTISFLYRLLRALPQMKGYDVVQLINPMFIELKPRWIYPIYKYLRKHNKKVFMCACGIDYYWVREGLKGVFRYGDFNLGEVKRTSPEIETMISSYILGPKKELNEYIAKDCDGIISGLFENDLCYRPYYSEKLKFIPLPINIGEITPRVPHSETEKIRFFIGIQKTRSEYKGTDIMYSCLLKLEERYRDKMEIIKVESVPYAQYCHLMDTSDVILDQLYSYTPSMNSLMAMAKGLVLVGGGEEENYEILGETEIRPIVNVLPNTEDVYNKLEALLLDPQDVLKRQELSVIYVKRHHDHIKVAKQYVDFWQSR